MTMKSSTKSRLDAIEEKLASVGELEERLQELDVAQTKRSDSLNEDLGRTIKLLDTLTARVRSLELQAGRVSPAGPSTASTPERRQSEDMETRMAELQNSINEINEECRSVVITLRKQIEEVDTKVTVTSRAVANLPTITMNADFSRSRVPEPRPYGGARDAKELENFLFDVEQYLRAVRVESEDAKVSIITMYLIGDAKLWWRTKYLDIQEGRCAIDSWEDLKRELKNQFLPVNVSYLARRQLRELRQVGTVRDYVKKFSGLMLDIRDMTEEDRLFFFLEGLKPWARTELQRQRVSDLSSAQAAAERLTDYSLDGPQSKRPLPTNGGNDSGSKRARNWGQTRSGGADKGIESSSSRAPVPVSWKKPVSCWLCDGPHRAAVCPKKSRLSAMLADGEQTNPSNDSQEEDETGHMVALRMLSAIKKQTEARPVTGKGLMFVDASINGVAARSVMVDTGATHNFISTVEAERLGLKLEPDVGRMKAVNSQALPTSGVAKQVPMMIGPWEGQVDLVVVQMDDFDVVLGMDFLLEKGVVPITYAGNLLIMGT